MWLFQLAESIMLFLSVLAYVAPTSYGCLLYI